MKKDTKNNQETTTKSSSIHTVIIPRCLGYKYWTDCGYEHDCDYENGVECDNCICVTSKHGFDGIDPRTGKIMKLV